MDFCGDRGSWSRRPYVPRTSLLAHLVLKLGLLAHLVLTLGLIACLHECLPAFSTRGIERTHLLSRQDDGAATLVQ